MSADDFDPAIERLFARTQLLPDEALFAAEVRAKLETRSRWRTLALTAAGVVGGCVAVREGVTLNFDGARETTTLSQGAQAAAATAQGAVQSSLDGLGLGAVDLTGGSGMLAFWIAAGALLALLAAAAVRLSQEA